MNGVSNSLQLVKRNVLRNFRIPQLLVFSSIQPIMFLLLFNYVFGGAIGAAAPGGAGADDYINFLLPGILAQVALFGAIQTGVGLAEDINKGVIDRLRSLPIARYAVLAGRTLADSFRNVIVITIMMIVGFMLGFRFEEGVINFLLAAGLVILFAFAFSWISATIGLLIKNVESVQVAGFLWVFPLVFASSVFVPTATMPGWLQAFANNQPVSQVVDAVRYLTHGIGDGDAVWLTLLWVAGIIAVFAPIAVWRYRKIQ
jgi:ABC-2 type transport system permease protein/oleandomycin transport system permease protein